MEKKIFLKTPPKEKREFLNHPVKKNLCFIDLSISFDFFIKLRHFIKFNVFISCTLGWVTVCGLNLLKSKLKVEKLIIFWLLFSVLIIFPYIRIIFFEIFSSIKTSPLCATIIWDLFSSIFSLMIIFSKILLLFLSTKIVRFAIPSINFFGFIIEENKSISDDLK